MRGGNCVEAGGVTALLLAVLNPLLIGGAVAILGLGGKRTLKTWGLIAALAPGLGMAAISGLHFLWTLSVGPGRATGAYLVVETGLGAGLAWLAFRSVKASPEKLTWRPPLRLGRAETWAALAAGGVFVFLLASYLTGWVGTTLQNPHGHWDAWSIWNLRARFLFSGETWRSSFDPGLGWSHPGYPLLLPQFTARSWILIGSRSLAVPAGIGLVFSLEIIAVIVFAVATLRGWVEALTAGSFAVLAVSAGLAFLQYADLTLAFFILSSSFFFLLGEIEGSPLRPRLVLTGFALSAAAWTKDEGLIWLGIAAAVEVLRWALLRQVFRGSMRRARGLALGMLPLIVVLVLFKTQVASPDPGLVDLSLAALLQRTGDMERYRIAGAAFLQALLSGTRYLIPLLMGYWVIMGGAPRRSVWPSWLRVLLLCAVYFSVYIVTPYPQQWHLDNSINRLFAQFIPVVILLVFVCARRMGAAQSEQGLRMAVGEF